MKLNFNQITLDISSDGTTFILTLDDKTIGAEVLYAENGKLDLLIDSERVTAYVSSDNAKRWVTVNGQTFVLTKSSGAKRSGHAHHAAGELTAPMPGQVRAVNVNEGDTVTKGQTLLVMEAMKMEIRVHAPFDGVVQSLTVKVGQTVEREQILVKMDHG
jgi:acetyl/propionyl-CoA carboxylase alpha subunit